MDSTIRSSGHVPSDNTTSATANRKRTCSGPDHSAVAVLGPLSLDCDSSRLFRDTNLRQVMRMLCDMYLHSHLRHVCVAYVARMLHERRHEPSICVKFRRQFADIFRATFALMFVRYSGEFLLLARYVPNVAKEEL